MREAAATGSAEEVVWAGWAASGLADRLERDSLAGGSRGAVADRALDAVIGLLDAAARYVDRLPGSGVLGFLDDVDAQEVPADSLSQRTPEGDAVRVLTAHASKGLEWRVVVVAGVQEGAWPDLRARGSLLGAGELAELAQGRGGPATGARPAGRGPGRGAPAVLRRRDPGPRAPGGHGGRGRGGRRRPAEPLPGGARPAAARDGDPRRPARSPGSGLLAELRRAAATSPDPALREAACRRLARLVTGDRAPRVATADPDRWWGLAPLSDDAPVVGEGETVRVSPSKVESFDACALRWFLVSAVGVSGSSGPAAGARAAWCTPCASWRAGPTRSTARALEERLDAVLPELDLGAPWAVVRRRGEALAWLAKFVQWAATNPRELVATELDVRVPLRPGAELSGRVDRLERDEQGRAVVVDLKTGTSKPGRDELARHPQLGVYQLAVELGAFAEQQLERSGGASLLQLKTTQGPRTSSSRPRSPTTRSPAGPASSSGGSCEGMSGAAFPATAHDGCRTCPVKTCCPVWPEGAGVLR